METNFSKDSKTRNNYIVFFDLDRTITQVISGEELVRGAFKKGLMTRSDRAYTIYLLLVHKFNLKGPMKILWKLISRVKGIPEKIMADLCSEVILGVILPSVYKEAKSEIKIHKKNNSKVVILSSALTPVCQEVAKNLDMDDFICSDLEINNGYFTGRLRGRLCFGEEKVVRLKEYCENNNTSVSDAWYYGDSISDLPVLSYVGNPVCVNPDRKLKKEAHKRGWKILHWN